MSQPKFCAKCGNKLDENEKFCGKCGASAEESKAAVQSEQPSSAAAIPAVKDKKKVMLALIAAAAVVALIVVIIIIVNVTKYQKIDAKDLFRIEFRGINGSGKCTAALNCPTEDDYLSDMLDELYVDEESGEDYSDYFSDDKKTLLDVYTKAKDKGEAEDMRDALMKVNKKTGEYELQLDLSDDENLTNGDKITCTVEYDEDELKEEKIKLVNTEFEVEVKGLKEGTKLDMFEDFNVKFSGTDGNGEAEYPSQSEKYPFISYYNVTGSYDLTNGDTFTVEAYISGSVGDIEYVDPEDSESGMYFTYEDVTYVIDDTSVSKDFVVEGLTEPEEIDVFEGIEFETSGAIPKIRITGVKTDNCAEIVKENVSFSVEDYSKEYDAGDKFVIKAYVSSYLEDEGYKAAGTKNADGYYTKEFTVDEASFNKYLTDESSYEDFMKLDDLFNEQVNEFKSDYSGKSYISGLSSFDGKIKSFESFDADSVYYSYIAESDSLFSSGDTSYVYRVYKVKVKLDDDDKSTETFYVAFAANAPYVTPDGKAEVSSSYISVYANAKKSDLVKERIRTEGAEVTEIKKDSSSAADSKDDSSSQAETSSKADSDSSEMVP
ncbi:zinc ribbon domain-containing protein [Ruminococcus sp. Marseille-P6503]|uniref:zinc ribbon domain-containing protein n=1 Tax=Ruminococcus sp. Marseille-P6503 TaxID=2364796 RepID=UPI000F53EFB0|nr:zinc ribbon domain-containing protein [Ruminococcus sp. Marseille-P6503]